MVDLLTLFELAMKEMSNKYVNYRKSCLILIIDKFSLSVYKLKQKYCQEFNKIIAYVTINSTTDFCHITFYLHKSISTLVSPNTTATSVNTTAHVPEVPELKEKEPAEKSYTGTAGLGSLGR